MNLNLKQNLDIDQYNAVMSQDRRLLCLANAGSGKTRMLTFRAANFIACGFQQHMILMLTFTKKAANEMKTRIATLLNTPYVKSTAGTFHGIACRMIRQYPEFSGLPENFSIFDTDDSLMYITAGIHNLCEEDPKIKNYKNKPTAKNILSAYSFCRNTGLEYKNEFYVRYADGISNLIPDMCVEVIRRYEESKRAAAALNFDDLLIKFSQMLDNPEFQKIIQTRFPAVFVDEYQDINLIQHAIIKKLLGPNSYLTAVGDDAQCIYGFRGSQVGYITSFEQDFQNAKVLYLPKNYRSSESIVNTAVSVINNEEYLTGNEKIMTAVRSTKTPEPNFIMLQNETAQAEYIAAQCLAAKSRMDWKDMAVLVRTNRNACMIESALLKLRIPVDMECGTAFYKRQQIRMVIKFLDFVQNPQNKAAFKAFMKHCPKIGDKTQDKMFEAMAANQYKLTEIAKITPAGSAAKETHKKLVKIMTEIEELRHDGCDEPRILAQVFTENYLMEWCMNEYKDDPKQVAQRLSEIQELLEQLDAYPDLKTFLEDANLNTDDAKTQDNNRVKIMTIHKSKGLEFRKVFLTNMSQGLFPSYHQIGNQTEMEEELRVLYVAITRAMDELDILAIKNTNRIPNQDRNTDLEPSEFLKHLTFTEL